jgi:ATP-dependent RNA helicase RhlE
LFSSDRPSLEFQVIHDSRFRALGLCEPLLRSLAQEGYQEPTPIQAEAIPEVLAGADVLAAAQTGTGKTAAFVLPILQRLTQNAGRTRATAPRCLIIAPTRELAAQVEAAVRTYGKHLKIAAMALFGGVAIEPQISRLRKPVDVLVATPGRLLDHVTRRTVELSRIEVLVLDEADRMLDMGFLPDIKRVIALLPGSKQTLLFSATFPNEIRTLAQGIMRNPATIDVAPRNAPIGLVAQSVHLCARSEKPRVLCDVLREHAGRQALVFTKTKHGANRLVERLGKAGIRAAAIHGNKSQAARVRALAEFKSGTVPVLVATDIAARGLDIEDLPQVVNFELPHVPEDYVHRIGRTGRAGATGSALSLVDPEEIGLLRAIERLIKKPIQRVSAAGFAPRAALAR